jgi:hypothetical protein
VQNTDITDGHAFPHKVEVDLDMFHALVLNEVGGEVDEVGAKRHIIARGGPACL